MAEVTRVTQAGMVLILDANPSIRASQAGTVLVATGVRGEPEPPAGAGVLPSHIHIGINIGIQ